MLSKSQIIERLAKGEIFRPATWLQNNLNATSYDIRMARDYMVVPDEISPEGLKYQEGQYRSEPVILKPGDIAFVSSEERLAIPFDIAVNIGHTFRFSEKGLLLLTGLIVDPGYGYKVVENNWLPSENTRLHFFIANLGTNRVEIQPGDEIIASLQFFSIVNNAPSVAVATEGVNSLRKKMTDPKSRWEAGLGFVKSIADMQKQLHVLAKDMNESNEKISLNSQELNKLLATNMRLENRSEQILMFGIYLISSTIFSVAMAAILQVLSSIITNKAIDPTSQASVTLIIVFGLIAVVSLVIYFLRLLLKVSDSINKKN